MKKTSLYQEHIKLNAKIVPFAGYEMPINYSEGIQFEYESIRNNVGVFDVSHMGQIVVSGEESFEFLQYLTINDLNLIDVNGAQYNAICNNNGGIKDDIIVYKFKSKYILIVNASNCEKIFEWMLKNNTFNCSISNDSDQFSLIAVQGPSSRKMLNEIIQFNNSLKFYNHEVSKFNNQKILLSRTGYTGELGYEILGEHDIIVEIWKKLIALDATPCGLAVRDILRLEVKYCLYGNDLNEDITPIDAGLDWILKLEKDNFLGKKNLLKEKENGSSKELVCLEMFDKCIPRKGFDVYLNNDIIGKVTSGTFSLGLKKGIAMCSIDRGHYKKNLEISLKIRNSFKRGKMSKSPFITKTSLHD